MTLLTFLSKLIAGLRKKNSKWGNQRWDNGGLPMREYKITGTIKRGK